MIRIKLKTIAAILLSQSAALIVCGQEAAVATLSSTPESRLTQGGWKNRWESQLKAIESNKECELFFIGDSITQAWDGTGKATWEKEFERYKPINFGISGDRTEHVIWRMRNAPELSKLKPKVAVIMIGTNNTGHDKRDAADTADGIKTIVSDLRALWPDTKIILFGVFPRGDTAEHPLRKINNSVNEIIAKFDDGKHVHYIDITDDFLDDDGSLPKTIMPDLLHLSPQGYEIWGKALATKLKDLGM